MHQVGVTGNVITRHENAGGRLDFVDLTNHLVIGVETALWGATVLLRTSGLGFGAVKV